MSTHKEYLEILQKEIGSLDYSIQIQKKGSINSRDMLLVILGNAVIHLLEQDEEKTKS